jgi:lysyl-tRNA synthetase class 2
MAETLSDQQQQRFLKLERVLARGIDPYPARSARTHTTAQAIAAFEAAEVAPEVQVVGRLRSIRVMGKSTFAHLEDGSGRLQLYFKKDILGEEDYQFFTQDFDIGDFIQAQGPLFRTRTGEVTLQVRKFAMLAKALNSLPEKWHGLRDVETRYRQRYLDLIANEEVRKIFIARTRIVSAMRRFMDGRGFLEVETPTLQPLYGGAMARPFTTYHNALDQTLYLRISDELYLKRLIVGGFERVYEICKDFRNEGISTQHNPEFTLMECYWAYADYHDIMALTEEMVASIAQEVLGTTKITHQGREIELAPPWKRLTLRQAIEEATGIDYLAYPDLESLRREVQARNLEVTPKRSWGKLVEELLSEFVEPGLVAPTFIMDYPLEISPLSKASPADERLVERFEAYAIGMEIANAYSELNAPLTQRERFEMEISGREAGDEEAHPMDEDYVQALMYGMPPTGGLGVGVDRLVMLLTDQVSIREVILFPHLRAKER